jgi:uncharacterized protein
VYREAQGFRSQLQSLIPAFFNPIAAVHHYCSMARAAFDACDANGTITTKKLFYTLRALLACRWIERTISQPPTEFARLVDCVAHEEEKSWIARLLEQKAEGREFDTTTLTRERRNSIVNGLADFATYAKRAPPSTKGSDAQLDSILSQWAHAL